ncbi:MAG: dihydroorotate dehydrogenase, partial [Candidatus Subteraquimicrobiales bacterium]|nr:dihydroorotate dehydrogenase [Candidatus Subteraquimicrobiales bacterium]
FASGREYSEFADLNKLGAIVTKTVTLKERKGNLPPRICETPSGMLNAIGLQNKGVEYFLADDLPFLRKFDVPVIANVAGDTLEEYVEVSKRLSEAKVDGIELNISCPNVKKGGMVFGTNSEMAAEVVRAVKKVINVALIIKLTPNVTDIAEIAKSVEKAGADAISLINTPLGMAVDIETFEPELANITGGLSGPAIKPLAVRMVWQVSKAVKVPVIGMGGIMNASDAIEFFLVGASAVAVGTANFIHPTATINIIEGIEEFLKKKSFKSVSEIVGKLRFSV